MSVMSPAAIMVPPTTTASPSWISVIPPITTSSSSRRISCNPSIIIFVVAPSSAVFNIPVITFPFDIWVTATSFAAVISCDFIVNVCGIENPVAPISFEYFPGGHSTQSRSLTRPFDVEYLPESHFRHADDASLPVCSLYKPLSLIKNNLAGKKRN